MDTEDFTLTETADDLVSAILDEHERELFDDELVEVLTMTPQHEIEIAARRIHRLPAHGGADPWNCSGLPSRGLDLTRAGGQEHPAPAARG